MSDINSELEKVRAELKKGTPFLAVEDGNYFPRNGEETLDIMGKKLVLKRPGAFSKFVDAAKAYDDFISNDNLNAIDDMLFKAIEYPPNEVRNLKEVRSHYGKLLKMTVISSFDYMLKHSSIGSKYEIYNADIEYYFKQLWGKNYFYSIFDDFCRTHYIEEFVERFDLEFRQLMETYAYVIRDQSNVVVFSVEEYSGGKPVSSNFKRSERIIDLIRYNKKNLSDSDMLDLYLAAICIDPYYKNGWLFFSMTETFGYNAEVIKIANYFMPYLAPKWRTRMGKYIDDKYYFSSDDDDDDKEELYKRLVRINKAYSSDLARVGLSENMTTPQRKKIKDKIDELEHEKREAELEQIRQEAIRRNREERANRPDKVSVAWILVVSLLIGPIGIIPAIVFFTSNKPKRALSCLIPALVWIMIFIIMNIVANVVSSM